MKKQLFLHIGSHKTATTFLQSSFANNRPVLDDLGILYPKAGRIYQAHFKLSWALKNTERKDKSLEDLEEWAALFDEIDAAPQDVAVISTEEFGLGIDPARLSSLSERYDVFVIFYLRSPDSYMESFYNQFVKDFDTRETRRIDTYMMEQNLFFLDTMKILRPWMNVFGVGAIRLRIYDRKYLPNGILSDFLSAMECKRFPKFTAADAATMHKASLPPDALEYLRLSNRWLTRKEGHYQFVVRLVEIGQKYTNELQRTNSGILSLKARKAIRLRFRDTNFQAAKMFLGMDRTPFPTHKATPPVDYDQRLPEANAQIMGRVAAMIRNMGDDI